MTTWDAVWNAALPKRERRIILIIPFKAANGAGALGADRATVSKTFLNVVNITLCVQKK
jgi:hypothetical protein